jgi:hypothetical protein
MTFEKEKCLRSMFLEGGIDEGKDDRSNVSVFNILMVLETLVYLAISMMAFLICFAVCSAVGL